jgi:hypothetical protein
VFSGAYERPIVVARELADACQGIVDGNRAVDVGPQQELPGALADVALGRARPLEMEQGVVARRRGRRCPGCRPPLLGLGPPVFGQSEVMAFGLEDGASLLEQRDALILRDLARPREVERAESHRSSRSRN